MSYTNAMRKTKLTVTISGDVANEIDKIAKKKRTPRSKIMEDILRDWLLRFQKKRIEKDIEAYYLSITDEEKEEDKKWSQLSAKRVLND